MLIPVVAVNDASAWVARRLEGAHDLTPTARTFYLRMAKAKARKILASGH